MLAAEVRAHLAAGEARRDAGAGVPKAIIVPHAGYMYSGPIAASAYARLAGGRETIRRVVLFGPAASRAGARARAAFDSRRSRHRSAASPSIAPPPISR